MTRQYYYNTDFSVVERTDDVIFVRNLDNSRVVSEFIRAINSGRKQGIDSFKIDFYDVTAAYPNAVTQIAGIVEHLQKEGIAFSFDGVPEILEQIKMLEPALFSLSSQSDKSHILDRVWKFSNSDDVSELVDAYISELQKRDRFHKGMLDSIEWALNEVMDNVIQHADTDCGYVMGQLHLKRKYIAFAIFDAGRGIYNSLKASGNHSPKNTIDAITLAIKEEVTRDESIGQGNGLYGLHSIVKQGKGRLAITSGSGSYMYERTRPMTLEKIPYLSDVPCTIVDFQLDYSADLSLDRALVFRGKPYNFVNYKIENLENEADEVVYKIKEHAEGTGTRASADRVKNEIFNILQTSPRAIVLDFEGVAVISSSFADELIAKLILELGLFQFNNLIRLRNMDFSQQSILQRSVIQRLIENFK